MVIRPSPEAAGAWAEPGEMDPPSEHPLLRRESGEPQDRWLQRVGNTPMKSQET